MTWVKKKCNGDLTQCISHHQGECNAGFKVAEEVDQRLRSDGYTNFYGDKKGQRNLMFIV
jgi:hypothetical protein